MSGHTPAPWFVELGALRGEGGKLIEVSGLSMAHFSRGDGGPEAAANAALISAAPELLAAVKALLKLHENHHNQPLHAQARDIVRKAEARK